jgi:hypothetical protein
MSLDLFIGSTVPPRSIESCMSISHTTIHCSDRAPMRWLCLQKYCPPLSGAFAAQEGRSRYRRCDGGEPSSGLDESGREAQGHGTPLGRSLSGTQSGRLPPPGIAMMHGPHPHPQVESMSFLSTEAFPASAVQCANASFVWMA